MSFDRMGRRVEYLETAGGSQSSVTETNAYHCFLYDNYLCIQRLDAANGNAVDLAFVWDVTEPVATRPLIVDKPEVCRACVTHDGNKNVADLATMSVTPELVAHYEYSSFGSEKMPSRFCSDGVIDFYQCNPVRFSSEYYDSSLGLICYNYRHYNSGDGRWVKFDAVGELGGINLFCFLYNNPIADVDVLGLRLKPEKDGRVRRYYEQVSKGVGKSSFRETYNLAAYEKAYSKFEETINEAIRKLEQCCDKAALRNNIICGLVKDSTRDIPIVLTIYVKGATIRNFANGSGGGAPYIEYREGYDLDRGQLQQPFSYQDAKGEWHKESLETLIFHELTHYYYLYAKKEQVKEPAPLSNEEAKLFGTIDEREAVFQENELRKCCPGLRDSVLRYAHKKQEK